MTPNNILNMAMLNGLDIIAITDHNSTKQLKVISQLQESYDFVIVPGVEVSVKEKFDVLCYFKSFKDAINFDSYLSTHLCGEWNNYTKENQVITDIYDNTFEEVETPLTETNIPYKNLVDEVRRYDGLIVLAHINRPSCSPLNTYSLNEIEFDAIEISPYGKDKFLNEHPNYMDYMMFHNSDSHSLLTMLEKDYSIELEEKSIEGFFKYVRGAK
jgi:hypothetical protein